MRIEPYKFGVPFHFLFRLGMIGIGGEPARNWISLPDPRESEKLLLGGDGCVEKNRWSLQMYSGESRDTRSF